MSFGVDFGNGNVVPANPNDPSSMVTVEGIFKIPMRLIMESAQSGQPLTAVVPIVGVGCDLQIQATMTEEPASPAAEAPAPAAAPAAGPSPGAAASMA
jgi:hypothetical protein